MECSFEKNGCPTLVNLVRLTLFFLYQWQLKTYSETLVLNNNITEYWFPKKPGLEHLFCDIWFYLPLIILNYRAKRSRPDRQYMPGSSIMTLYCSVERQYRYIYQDIDILRQLEGHKTADSNLVYKVQKKNLNQCIKSGPVTTGTYATLFVLVL